MNKQQNPRPHAELAARYMADSTLKCWYWAEAGQEWAHDPYPLWIPILKYHVGHEPPTEPPRKMCEMGEKRFPAPLAPAPGMGLYCGTVEITYNGNFLYRYIHRSHDDARDHAAAIVAAVQQAIEEAK